ncbi:MAG: DUF1727 domain-containing protein [Cyanobacteria bacterium SIG32]|nr:DUF1727 domain-containing protein [Cyanobacteria bacterium SIG32]
MKFYIALFISKLIYIVLKILRRPATSFAGFVALKICPDFMKYTKKSINKVFINITGTNGKTTTSGILAHILEENNQKIIHNVKGANMPSGIANVFVKNICPFKNYDYAVIETDEAYLTKIYDNVKGDCLIVTNLFCDQLDRYGDANFTAKTIQEAIDKNPNVKLILNADDPIVSKFGKDKNAVYFGLKNSCDYFADVKTFDDHIELLVNNSYSFRINLIGEYNAYNTLAAIATAIENGFSNEQIQNALNNYHTAFGRAETRIIDGHKALIQLIKNPTGVNEVLKTIDVNSHIIFAMNDEYADGRDISWLWDVDFSKLLSAKNPIVTSGTRAYDIANRLKYAGFPTEKIVVEQEIKKAIQLVLNNTTKDEKITILPSYTALLKISKY